MSNGPQTLPYTSSNKRKTPSSMINDVTASQKVRKVDHVDSNTEVQLEAVTIDPPPVPDNNTAMDVEGNQRCSSCDESIPGQSIDNVDVSQTMFSLSQVATTSDDVPRLVSSLTDVACRKEALSSLVAFAELSSDNKKILVNAVSGAKRGILVKLLQDDDIIIRQNALTLIAMHIGSLFYRRVEEEDFVCLLVSLLGDPNAETRAITATVINKLYKHNKSLILKTGAIQSLVSLLRDANAKVRRNAVGAICFITDNTFCKRTHESILVVSAGGIEPLLMLLQDSDTKSRRNAAITLWNIASNAEAQPLLASAGVIRILVDLFSDTEPDIRQETYFGLMPLLKDHKEYLTTSGIIEPLLMLLSHSDTSVRVYAALVLSKITGSGSTSMEQLKSMINDRDAIVKQQITKVLCDIASYNDLNKALFCKVVIIEPLVMLLEDNDSKIRADATEALGRIVEAAKMMFIIIPEFLITNLHIIGPLVSLLRDTCTEVRRNAAGALYTITEDRLFHKNCQEAKQCILLVASAGGVDSLVTLFQDSDTETRRNAAKALWNIASSAETQPSLVTAGVMSSLVQLFADTDPDIRRETFVMFMKFLLEQNGFLSTSGAIEALLRLLDHVDIAVRVYTAFALSHLLSDANSHEQFACDAVISQLVLLLQEADPEVKQQVMKVLCDVSSDKQNHVMIFKAGLIEPLVTLLRDIHFRGNVVRLLSDVVNSKNTEVSNGIQRLLANVGAIAPLMSMLGDTDDVACSYSTSCLSAIASNKENKELFSTSGAIDRLISLLHNSNEEISFNVTQVLVSFVEGNPESAMLLARTGAIEPLIALLEDTNANYFVTKNSLGVLAQMSTHADVAMLVTNAGALQPLVALLGDHESDIRSYTAQTVSNLALNEEIHALIANAGAIEPLVLLLSDSDTCCKAIAAETLWSLSVHKPTNALIANAGAIGPLVALLSDSSVAVRSRSAGALVSLSTRADNVALIVEAGGIEPLVLLLGDDCQFTRRYATDTLSNIVVLHGEINVLLVRAGAIKPLVSLLRDTDLSVRNRALLILGKLAVHKENLPLIIARADAIESLTTFLRDADSGILQRATELILFLVSLLRHTDTVVRRDAVIAVARVSFETIETQSLLALSGTIDSLAVLLRDTDAEIRRYAAVAIGNAACNRCNQVFAAKAGAMEPLVAMLRSTITEVRRAAARALSQLTLNNKENQVLSVETGVLPPLVSLLRDKDTEVRRYVTTALLTLIRDPTSSDTKVAEARLASITPLVMLLRDVGGDCRRNAVEGLSIIASSNLEASKLIANAGAIEPLTLLLEDADSDIRTYASAVLSEVTVGLTK